MKNFQPVIKWSGSKRSQANEIISFFPKEINTYFEPFLGGGSILRTLLENKDIITVNKCHCSDINNDLIKLWNKIAFTPLMLSDEYLGRHNELKRMENIAEKRSYYEDIRSRFNKEKDPFDFFFLLRTCYNGLVRYNRNGDFNSPFHLNRNGMDAERMSKIIFDWSNVINENTVSFQCHSYEDIKPEENDFVYLDPPYANTNSSMYNGGFDNNSFFEWLRELKCGWILSYDGKSGNDDNTFNVPKDLYDEHLYIKSGNSSFKRIKKSDTNAVVYESLYIKRNV